MNRRFFVTNHLVRFVLTGDLSPGSLFPTPGAPADPVARNWRALFLAHHSCLQSCFQPFCFFNQEGERPWIDAICWEFSGQAQSA